MENLKKKKKKKKRVEVASDYADVDNSFMYPKFVVADRTDIQEAGRAVRTKSRR